LLLQHELKEVEEKFRKAMIQTAQLDNEKSSLTYQVELLKDRLEDLEEAQSQLQVCGVSLLSFIHYAIVWRTVPMNFVYFF
jgi:predicted nuclease with TOPRIM domain